MQTVTVLNAFQVTIPRQVCEQVGIHIGEMLQVIPYNGRIELVRVRDMKSMRGFLGGIDISVPRDGDRV